jgi:hypothetical protein
MSDTICLPKEHYTVLFIVFTLITLFYLYSMNKKDFKLDLNNVLTSESVKVREIISPSKQYVNPVVEKRLILENRDRKALNDDLAPPERRDPEHAYPDRQVKNIINLPTRGVPDNYHSVGVLVRKNDEKVLQLFGRQKYPGSNQWEYYVSGMDRYGFPNKMPIKMKGDKEVNDKDKINIDWLDSSKGDFEVNLYNFDVPRYNPFDY